MTMTAADLQALQPAMNDTAPRTFLNVGCGSAGPERLPECLRQPGWRQIRLDINPDVEPDILADTTDLSAVESESVDAVFSSHNLEHLDDHAVPTALAEMHRVIRPGGFLLITLPDLQQVAQWVAQGKLTETLYDSPAGPITPLDILYGHRASVARGNHYMAHRTGFDTQRLGQVLRAAGFAEVRVTADAHYNLWGYARK
ncbi:class I SAM-dependent methyltransferase [Modicisalibacter tunisiensis]|uniref:Methyltransferase domain-containing protein n=1 Tax=Modicisalibacter tunisiensis TaxID=390637 RepID=A0ABS7WVM6_9GAMM|nr:class I SAM-dependent methyltransferase [Modicisalibacter tunisiensis]MBZ9566652.1 methyltransferase domain-containing protein [Modicisalibacter tunisiensis]